LRPDMDAPNRERNVFEDDTHGYLGSGCPVKEGILPGKTGEPKEFCTALKGEWPRVVCNNAVVDPELMLCGVHIKKVREAEEYEERMNANSQERQAAHVGLTEICQRIKDNFNLEVSPSNQSWQRMEMSVKVNPFDLEDLLLSFANKEEVTADEG
jgi:hypothetical protein